MVDLHAGHESENRLSDLSYVITHLMPSITLRLSKEKELTMTTEYIVLRLSSQ